MLLGVGSQFSCSHHVCTAAFSFPHACASTTSVVQCVEQHLVYSILQIYYTKCCSAVWQQLPQSALCDAGLVKPARNSLPLHSWHWVVIWLACVALHNCLHHVAPVPTRAARLGMGALLEVMSWQKIALVGINHSHMPCTRPPAPSC